MSNYILEPLLAGWDTLAAYLAEHVLTCLVPAFFIAGAIAVFISKEGVMRYFGGQVQRWLSYSVASVSGVILAVCSCTVLPLFTGIYKRGAGLGPATTFLYAGPAINILAIAYTATALGYDLGAARAVSAVLLAIVVGLVMALVFHREEAAREPPQGFVNLPAAQVATRPRWVVPLFFVLLVALLITATASPKLDPGLGEERFTWAKFTLVYGDTLLIAYLLIFYFQRSEVSEWGHETFDLSKKIFPLLVGGTFLLGMVGYFLPPETFEDYLGDESLRACLTGAVIGGLLYMPTLLEVPLIGDTFGYSDGMMGSGPALALLLAGPSISLPSLLVIHRVLGLRKTAVYAFTVVLLSTLAGFIYGNLIL